MAVRTLTLLLAGLLLAVAVAAPAPVAACFGPKLYVGLSAEPRQELLFALTALYVFEKTGVESERVELPAAADRGAELRAERVDMAIAAASIDGGETLLAVPGWPLLASGQRPLTDLQFTTVIPALRKLARLLTIADLTAMEARVAGGEKPAAAARWLCRERRWL